MSRPPFLNEPGAIMPVELHGLGPSVLVTVSGDTPRPSAANFGHAHGEAFCLMAYASRDGSQREVLWNSRDGVTPFGLHAADKSGELFHVTWPLDVYAPAFIPPVGMRVFIDLTEEAARAHVERQVERDWENPTYPMSRAFASKQEAVKRLTDSHMERAGQPDVVVVTEAMQSEFIERANRLYVKGSL